MTLEATLETLRPKFAAQYAIERELGRGGMGVVFLARELSLDRMVAIKVLPPRLADSAEVCQRFLREARTAAQLSHPNIVPIFRADAIDGMAYFAMGYIDGETLAERLLARGALSPGEAVRILREVAWALAYAHARGVVHRDIKPENVMLERGSGRVIVTDFGIARDTRATALTADGMVLGSVHYMSPEQVAGGAIDGRSDLYALGIVAFQLLSGRLPFDAPQASAVLLQQATAAAPSLREVAPDVPAPLAAVVERALRKDPAERYATGEAMAEALTEALQNAQSGPQAVPERVLDEETARAVWLRAAQLQADASRRIQERTSRAEEFATGMHSVPPTSGYRQGDVEAAAVEAGIAEEFVQLALAELPDDEALLPVRYELGSGRLEHFVLGNVERSIGASKVIPASPVKTLEALGQVFPAQPWHLAFRDTVGGHPLDGGVLTFTVREMSASDYMTPGASSSLRYYLSIIDAYQVRATLHPVAGDPRRCEVRVTADLREGLRKNARIGMWLGLGLGSSGAAIGVGTSLAAGAGLLALPVALGAMVVVGGAMIGVMRVSFRWGFRRTRRELEHLLEALSAHVRVQDVFGPQGSAPRPLPPG